MRKENGAWKANMRKCKDGKYVKRKDKTEGKGNKRKEGVKKRGGEGGNGRMGANYISCR